MNRSYTKNVIVLNIKPLGDNNSSVTLITDSNEIIYGTLYGGPKSKLKSLVAQYNSGKMWFYENPERKQTKISDFEIKNYHNSFSQNLFKMYAASLSAELAIKTKCAGNNNQFWTLINGFLDGLDIVNEEQGRVGLMRFLWRYLELMGIQPDATACSCCGKSFLTDLFAPYDESYYNIFENSFFCNYCTSKNSSGSRNIEQEFKIKVLGTRYLGATSILSPSEVRKLHIDKEAYDQIRNILFFLTENSIESKLNSIETGMGIL